MNEFDLEDMRQQMATLKKKLEQQEIVNDKLIRHSMKKNVNNINRRYTVIAVVSLLMVPYSYWAFVYLNGMSIGFWAATSAIMVLVFGYTLYTIGHLRDNNLLSDDLLKVRQKVAKAKKLDHDWLKIAIPIIILWLAYFFYECFKKSELLNEGLTLGYLGLICGAIGAAIGFSIHFKTQRQYQEIIDQIEDISKEE